MYLIRLWFENSQSAVAFIFIGRGGRTPSKSGYKRTLNYNSNSTRITKAQTGRPDRSGRSASVFANFGCQQKASVIITCVAVEEM